MFRLGSTNLESWTRSSALLREEEAQRVTLIAVDTSWVNENTGSKGHPYTVSVGRTALI